VTPHEIVDKLGELRLQLVTLDDSRHQTRVLAFVQSMDKTVKEREYAADFATLDLNRDIMNLRAEIRTLEDRLAVELRD
jgi:hypothetical protein